jgi:hypothetical protein
MALSSRESEMQKVRAHAELCSGAGAQRGKKVKAERSFVGFKVILS